MEDEIRIRREEQAGVRGGAAEQYAPAYAPAERVTMIGNVRWGAIWAGFVLAFGIQLILGSLVFAILITAGNGAVNTTALGILTAVVGIIALFSGGWAAGRLAKAGVTGGIWHAIWLWGLFVTLSIVATAMGVGSLLGAGLTTGTTGAAVDASSAIMAAWWSFIGIAVALVGTIFGGWVGGSRSVAEGEEPAM